MLNEAAHVHLGSEVRRRRELLGMTLEALAERSGMTPADVVVAEPLLAKRHRSIAPGSPIEEEWEP